MRVAVLLTGQPRYLEEGAWWLRNKIFPPNGLIKVDYYCYFWNDGSEQLEKRIVAAYNPVRYHVADYNKSIDAVVTTVRAYNKDHPEYMELVPTNIRETFLFDTYEIPQWGRNFWGQYLATDAINKMTGDLSSNYDIVIKTRSDAIFNNINERDWISSFNNMHRNPIFHNKMFAPWLYVDSGVPHMGDFCFISSPTTWNNYAKNIKQNCVDIVTKHKALFYELKVIDYEFLSHWMWIKASYLSKTDWLSFSTVWPTQFDITVLRGQVDITKTSYREIANIFHREMEERRKANEDSCVFDGADNR